MVIFLFNEIYSLKKQVNERLQAKLQYKGIFPIENKLED